MTIRSFTALLVSGLSATHLVTASAQGIRFFRISGPVEATITEATHNGTITWTNTATNATFTIQMATGVPTGSNWVEWLNVPVTNSVTAERIFDRNTPDGMVFIPAGSFTMGDNLDGSSFALPLHDVYVSAFYMDRTEVTNDKMVEVMQWAYDHGNISVSSNSVQNVEGDRQELLAIDSSDIRITWNGSRFQIKATKGAGYPCVRVTWYGAVAFCNYRSQMEGLAPCYDLSDWTCDWSANGYRLPTEAEWEKAARGGLNGRRFPSGDNISHDVANFNSSSLSYDTSATQGYHPDYDDGEIPYTSPVGAFAATGYEPGLYDMVGNVWEWCWDWVESTYPSSAPAINPRGPESGYFRIDRGGGWDVNAAYCRTAYRGGDNPTYNGNSTGLRCVRNADQ